MLMGVWAVPVIAEVAWESEEHKVTGKGGGISSGGGGGGGGGDGVGDRDISRGRVGDWEFRGKRDLA